MRTCASCQRPLGKVAARCMYCGTVATDVAPSQPARKPVLVTCPGCVRKVRAVPDDVASCSYCRLAFFAAADGTTRLGPLASATPASPAEVERLLAGLPTSKLWNLVRDVLVARAHVGDLVAGEAELAIESLAAIASAPTDRDLWLPLPLEAAEKLVPRVVFGVTDCGVFREQGDTVLLVALGSKPRANLDGPERAALNVLGFASQAAFGVGFNVEAEDKMTTTVRIQIRCRLLDVAGGVELVELANQIDQSLPTPISQAQRTAIAQRIATSRPMLASYFILGAMFGPSCRGGTAFSITREAITERLMRLACGNSAELVETLCIRMPPVLGT